MYKRLTRPVFRQGEMVLHPGFALFRQVKAQILANCVVMK